MKAVLGIDTASETSGVAVSREGRVLVETVLLSPSRHAERLLEVVQTVLQLAALPLEDLGLVAVTHGPGSFTGLRVGVATAKGLALSLGLPTVGVSSLAAMARGCSPFPGLVVPVLDARKGQVYCAAFDGATGLAAVEEGARAPEAFARELAARGRPCLFSGSGLTAYRSVFEDVLREGFHEAQDSRWAIPPSQVALLGERKWQAGVAVGAARLTPVYLRPSEAEAARRARSAPQGARV